MTKNDNKGFKANYNGEPIKKGEVMVPFEYDENDVRANCKNHECIRTIKKAGRTFKVVYKAVPEEWAKEAKSQFNLVQNEELGHYNVKNGISMDSCRDEYELELGQAASAEDEVMERENLKESVKTFCNLVTALLEKSPKLGYAVMLLHTGMKGTEFYSCLKLTREPANRIRKQADEILRGGLKNCGTAGIRCYHSPNDDYYKEEALKLLDRLVKSFE